MSVKSYKSASISAIGVCSFKRVGYLAFPHLAPREGLTVKLNRPLGVVSFPMSPKQRGRLRLASAAPCPVKRACFFTRRGDEYSLGRMRASSIDSGVTRYSCSARLPISVTAGALYRQRRLFSCRDHKRDDKRCRLFCTLLGLDTSAWRSARTVCLCNFVSAVCMVLMSNLGCMHGSTRDATETKPSCWVYGTRIVGRGTHLSSEVTRQLVSRAERTSEQKSRGFFQTLVRYCTKMPFSLPSETHACITGKWGLDRETSAIPPKAKMYKGSRQHE